MPTSKDLKDLDLQLKKTVISAESFKRGSSLDSSKSIANVHKTLSNLAGHVRKVVIRVGDLEKRVDNSSTKITSLKNISALQGSQIRGTNIGAKLPGGSVQNVDKNIASITNSVSSIAEILSGRKKLADDTAAYDRKKAEQEKRALAESKLEKRFDGLKRAAEKILSPVKTILDRIVEFLTTVFLGRVVFKLIEWWGNPSNAGKVKSIIRFLTDWGPALLGGFILFGTRFGKGVRILTRIALSGIAKLAKAIPSLLRFARGNPKTALALAAGTYATTQLAGRAFSGGDEKVQGFVGGGSVNVVRFSGGGLNLASLFGRTGNFFNGLVSGEKGVDKIPAMLSDGEFVMSAGAVQKYGVDTLEAMNSAGGGTNRPKVMSGTVYAKGGGFVGSDRTYGYRNSNTPFSKDPVDAINRFIKFKFGADISNQNTWGSRSPKVGTSPTSTGSLITDPVGAISRIVGGMGMNPQSPRSQSRSPNVFSRVMDAAKKKLGGGQKSGASKPGEKNFLQEISSKLSGPGASTYLDAGTVYASQMLGGFGGPVSERSLSGSSQKELQKAIERAKKRTGSEIAIVQAKIKALEAQGAGNTLEGKRALANEKSFLAKLKAGGIRVKYQDYAENGKMTESAENAKNILGQFWAYGRNKKQGGGYRIEDKYDFDPFKDPKTGREIDPMDVITGKHKFKDKNGKPIKTSVQQKLQAAYMLNPFRGSGNVDMVLGGKRTMAESLGLSASKTFLGGAFGASGNRSQPAKVAKTKPIGKPVKPPSKPSVIYTYPQSANKSKPSPIYKSSSPKVPSFSATTRGSSSKSNILGIPNQASYR